MRHVLVFMFLFTGCWVNSEALARQNDEVHWPRLVEAVKGQSFDALPWERLSFWVENDKLSLEVLTASLSHKSSSVKSFAVSILLRRGFEDKALEACNQELSDVNKDYWQVFARYGKLKTLLTLELLMEAQKDNAKKDFIASLLYQHKASEAARTFLLSTHDLNENKDALKLAELGMVDEVRSVLQQLKHHPSDQGQKASTYLKMDLAIRKHGGLTEKEAKEYKILYTESKKVLQGFVDNYEHVQHNEKTKSLAVQAYRLILREKKYRDTFSKYYNSIEDGEMLLWEILLDIQQNYVDDNRIDPKKLIEAAASGIATALDRHCSYMGVEETRRSNERFSGNYVGLGAIVSKTASGTVLIESVFFGAPAYKAGIRSGDQIIKVGEMSTVDFTLNENVEMMRGKENTEVIIKVFRKGWDKAVDYVINRQRIDTPTLFVEEMPGGIVYAKLTSFIATSDEDLLREIENMKRKMATRGQEMKGVILDLRDNGGGYLSTAVNICDAFLPKNKLIVYSEGRNSPKEEYFSKSEDVFSDLPLTIIVNKGSASASEIVSGCMRDHDRATLVGERTFGKGSVQNLYPLDSMGGDAMLRMTIAYYYLPKGECVHRRPGNLGGVSPDVVITREEETSDVVKELSRLNKEKVFTKYINDNLATDVPLMVKLAVEESDIKHYPNFDAWFLGLKTTLSQEKVLRELRLKVRVRAGEERGRYFLADWYSDKYLQAAVLELAKESDIDLKKVVEYSKLSEVK